MRPWRVASACAVLAVWRELRQLRASVARWSRTVAVRTPAEFRLPCRDGLACERSR